MARRKRPDNETPDETKIRRALETVADAATRSEKVSWDRKMVNMEGLMEILAPIENQIIDSMAKKSPIIDKINALRQEMVRECVHPYTHLAIRPDGTIQCKFCMKNFQVLTHGHKK